MADKSVIIKIKRQDTPTSKAYWEEFSVPYRPNMNVISALMDIAAEPSTREGKATTPITYDSNCLEEVCGSCAMLINGKARMACSALIDNLEQPIRLEPFSKFPVVRDLSVDRSVLFENLKIVKAWVPIDGTYDLGAGPRMSAEEQEIAYPISRCISCCCCMEACPQFNQSTGFVGAATIRWVTFCGADLTLFRKTNTTDLQLLSSNSRQVVAGGVHKPVPWDCSGMARRLPIKQ